MALHNPLALPGMRHFETTSALEKSRQVTGMTEDCDKAPRLSPLHKAIACARQTPLRRSQFTHLIQDLSAVCEGLVSMRKHFGHI